MDRHSDLYADGYEPPASVLTPSQREYLMGNKDLDSSAERAVRARIRERLRASPLDYTLILDELPLDDIDEAFSEEPLVSGGEVYLPLNPSISDVIALMYLANREYENVESHDGEVLESKIEYGLGRALNRLGDSFESISVDISIERGEPIEDLAQEKLSELSREELKQLLVVGEIDEVEFSKAVAEQEEGRDFEEIRKKYKEEYESKRDED